MENINLTSVWAIISWVAAAVILLANAVEKIIAAVKTARSPNDIQNTRLDALEADMREVKGKLDNDYQHLATLDEGNRVTQRALLALLAHGIDGNNVTQMENAKHELEEHLISR